MLVSSARVSSWRSGLEVNSSLTATATGCANDGLRPASAALAAHHCARRRTREWSGVCAEGGGRTCECRFLHDLQVITLPSAALDRDTSCEPRPPSTSRSARRSTGRRPGAGRADAVTVRREDARPLFCQAEPCRRLSGFPAQRHVQADDGGIGKAQRRRPVGPVAPHRHGRRPGKQLSLWAGLFPQFALRRRSGVSSGSTLPPGGTHPRTRCSTSSTCSNPGSMTHTSAASGSIACRRASSNPARAPSDSHTAGAPTQPLPKPSDRVHGGSPGPH